MSGVGVGGLASGGWRRGVGVWGLASGNPKKLHQLTQTRDPTQPIFHWLASGFGVGANANLSLVSGVGVGGLASGGWRRGVGVGGLASGVWRRVTQKNCIS